MRDYKSPEYAKARRDALRRDKYKCRKCGSNKRMQVHHIRPYHSNPSLLCDLNNLISLCLKCHSQMKNNEEAYIPLCISLLNKKVSLDIKRMLWDLKKEQEHDKQDD